MLGLGAQSFVIRAVTLTACVTSIGTAAGIVYLALMGQPIGELRDIFLPAFTATLALMSQSHATTTEAQPVIVANEGSDPVPVEDTPKKRSK